MVKRSTVGKSISKRNSINKHRKTSKNINLSKHTSSIKCAKSHIVRTLLEMINIVKLYHWKTRSFAEHKATDELHGSLNDNVDKFVEVYLGKDGSRVENWNKHLQIVQFDNASKFKDRIYEYREFLTNLNRCFDPKKDSDLLNIRDEILGDLNQFLYLSTFNK